MEPKTDWRSIYVLTLVGFLGSFKMAAMSSGLWAYMKLIDPHITESFFGALTSTSNFCNLITSLLAVSIVSGKTLWLFASFAYLSIELFPGKMKIAVMVMEICFGLSMGLMSVSRTHIAMASTESERPRAVSLMNLSITLGMAVGPSVMVVLSQLKYPGLSVFSTDLHINLYTAPMYLVLATTVVSLVLLVAWFDGRMRVPAKAEKEAERPAAAPKKRFQTSYDKVAVLVCCMTRVVQSIGMMFLMTVGGPYMMTAFGWNSKKLLTYNSVMHTAVGIFGVCVSISYLLKFTQRYVSERKAIIGAMSAKLLFFIVTYPYPFLESTIPYEVFDANGTIVQHGCSDRFDWCAWTPAVDPWVYCVAKVVCFGFGMPFLMLNLDVLYSRVLGPIKQGTMQGVFLVSGEILTILGPVIISGIYEKTGPKYIWQFNILTIGAILVTWIVFYDRMISATKRQDRKAAALSASNLQVIDEKTAQMEQAA